VTPRELNCLYVTGAVRYFDLGYCALVKDDMAAEKLDHSLFVEWDNGTWRGGEIAPMEWTTVGVTVVKVPSEQAVFLGYWGEILCIGGGDFHEERIFHSTEDLSREYGPMRGIRSIAGKAYAVGMNRQVYRRDAANVWTRIDQGLVPEKDTPEVFSLESIDGFTASEIYAVGRRGEIWNYDGSNWANSDSPTNMILTNVCCAEDGSVYVCGRLGTLLVGRNNQWRLIQQTMTEEDFWGIAWYAGRLYLATMQFLYTLENDELKRVHFGADSPTTCFHLSSADGVLWSIGAKDLMSFNGTKWSRLD
jgi:hypothetical protein